MASSIKFLTLGLLLALSTQLLAQNSTDESEAADTPSSAPVASKSNAPAKAEPKVDPVMAEKAKKFCALVAGCNRARPGKSAYCLKLSLKDSGLTTHLLGGDQAKEMPRFLRRDGFVDVEMGLKSFASLPDGAILVLDSHDPVKDRKPFCPKVYGNVLVKCDNQWIDDQKNELNFHMKRGCRTKGIWLHPGLIAKDPDAAKEK